MLNFSTWWSLLCFLLAWKLASASARLCSTWTAALKCCFFSFKISFCLTANPWPDPFHTNCNCQDPQLTLASTWWPSDPETHLFMDTVAWQPFRNTLKWQILPSSSQMVWGSRPFNTLPPCCTRLFSWWIFFCNARLSQETAVSSVELNHQCQRGFFGVCQTNSGLFRSLQMFLTLW